MLNAHWRSILLPSLLLVFSTSLVPAAQSPEPKLLKLCATALKSHATKVRQFLIGQESITHFQKEPTRPKKLARFLHEVSRFALSVLAPVPHSFLKTPTESLFEKQWLNGLKYAQLSAAEKALLQKYSAEIYFQEREAFLTAHPVWTPIRKNASRAARFFYAVSLAFTLNHSAQMALAHEPVQLADYTTRSEYKPQSTEVQIITDLVPFPHLAIRIGDKVYSYGYTHLSATPSNLYLNTTRIDQLLAPTQETARASTSADLTTFATKPLKEQPRSVQITTLRLTQEQRLNLKRDLENASAMRYYNSTFVNDCATMVVRALRRNTDLFIPTVLDASPSQVAMYLSALKTAGNPAVGETYTVIIDSPQTTRPQIARNLAINMLESKLFISLFHLNFPYRLALDQIKDEENLQSQDPELRAALLRWGEELDQTLRNDAQTQLFKASVLRLTANGAPPERLQELRNRIHNYYTEQIAAAAADQSNREADLREFTTAEQRALIYASIRAELLAELDADLKEGPL